MTSDPIYSFSFITGALFARESVVFARLLAKGLSWSEVEARVAEQNLLQTRKTASRVRLVREIRHRLSRLSAAEIEYFCSATAREQCALLFIAVCRHYRFVQDFVLEVLVFKIMSLDYQISLSDYSRFLDTKAAYHPELNTLTDTSLAKVRQVLFRMLHEAGLIDSTKSLRLNPPVLSRPFIRLIRQSDSRQLTWLLLTESEIKAAS